MTKKPSLITSSLNSLHQAQLDLEIYDESRNKKVLITALVDTGFSGDLAVPLFVAKALGLSLNKFQAIELELAIGESTGLISKQVVFIDQNQFELDVVWSEDMEEGLLGTGFLNKFSQYMKMDFEKQLLEVNLFPMTILTK